MLNIEMKSSCEKSCILTQYVPSVVQYDIAWSAKQNVIPKGYALRWNDPGGQAK